MVAYAAAPFLLLFLRAIVRSAAFWRRGLSQAVGRVSAPRMDAQWVDGYRRPSAVQGWDLGMVRLVLVGRRGPARHCPPRHPTRLEPSFLEFTCTP